MGHIALMLIVLLTAPTGVFAQAPQVAQGDVWSVVQDQATAIPCCVADQLPPFARVAGSREELGGARCPTCVTFRPGHRSAQQTLFVSDRRHVEDREARSSRTARCHHLRLT